MREFTGHLSRACSIAWCSKILSTGSRDRTILHRDLRASADYVAKSVGHR